MALENAPTTPAPTPAANATYINVTAPRDPGVFSGANGQDVDKWLSLYERVSTGNRWDPTLMLANVLFYLDGTPRVWYETHDTELTSWDLFKEKIRELFGNPDGHQLAAKKALSTRAQTSTEPYVMYIQDVLALCRAVDSHMTEQDKVAHILKGIADDAFNLLVFNNVCTVDAVIKECRRLELAKSKRILPQFARLPNTAPTSSCADVPRSTSNDANVTRIVRREIEAAYPATCEPSTCSPPAVPVSMIQAVVRQEIASMGLHSVCSVNHVDSRPHPPTAPPSPTQFQPRFRNAEWRTADDRPICFICHRIGHISRHCRNRWNSPAQHTYTGYNRAYGSYRPSTARADHAATESVAPSRPYSRSPSPLRRQSRSPQPRRSNSPSFNARSHPEN